MRYEDFWLDAGVRNRVTTIMPCVDPSMQPQRGNIVMQISHDARSGK